METCTHVFTPEKELRINQIVPMSALVNHQEFIRVSKGKMGEEVPTEVEMTEGSCITKRPP